LLTRDASRRADENAIKKLKTIDPEQTTPLEALNILVKLKDMIGDDD